jgi:uncharacterized protein YkwD
VRKQTLLIVGFIIVLLSIPILIFELKQNQDLREHASGLNPTATPTVVPQQPTLNPNEWNFLQIINSYRANLGLSPLKISVKLEQAAKWEANDLSVSGALSHIDSLGRNPDDRIRAFGYNSSSAAENVTASSSDAQTAFNQFISACDPNSSGTCQYAHKVNIERPEMNAIGIGAQAYTTGQYMGSYVWVTDFGSVLDSEITPPNTISTTPSQQPSPTSVVVTQEISPTQPILSETPTVNPTLPSATPTEISQTPTLTSTETPTPTLSINPTASASATPIVETPTTTNPTSTIANPGGTTQTMGIIAGVIIVILGGLFLLAL